MEKENETKKENLTDKDKDKKLSNKTKIPTCVEDVEGLEYITE